MRPDITRLLSWTVPLALAARGASSGVVPVGLDAYALSEMRAEAIGAEHARKQRS